MKSYGLIIPVAILVTYSQLAVKWRATTLEQSQNFTFSEKIIQYITDPIIISAYCAALLASFAWLFVITKLPLAGAFPIYIGITFLMVLAGGYVFLSEPMSPGKLLAVVLIASGIVIGVHADG